MARPRLIDLFSETERLDEKTMDSLKEALDAYPFFQAGRMLWIKNLHKLDHIRYNSELKLAAAYVPDRSKLFFLINDVFSPVAPPVPDKRKDSELTTQKNVSPKSDERSDKGLDDAIGSLTPADDNENRPKRNNEFDQSVGYDANYFDVDDSFTSALGELVDFSISLDPNRNEISVEEDSGDNRDADHIVLPSADLLDYEKETYSSAYSLEKEVPLPNDVDFNERHSFSEWLNLLRHQPVKPEGEDHDKQDDQTSQKSGKMDLIENFLNNAGNQTRIVPSTNSNATNEDIAARSVEESDDLMTETLANIHIKQQHYSKAIEIFERLRLKYPEKSVYFARRIEEMEELINNQ